MSTPRYLFCCPACGNRDTAAIQDNGEPYRSPRLTLLCVAPCAPEVSTLDADSFEPGEPVVCGAQWDPNDPD
jgi:hypothetical protein